MAVNCDKGAIHLTTCLHVILTSLVILSGWYLLQLKIEVDGLSAQVELHVYGQDDMTAKVEKRQIDVPSWVRGPAGPPGRDGRQGLPGPQGQPGPAGQDSVSYTLIDQHIKLSVTSLVDQEYENLRKAARSLPGVTGGTYVRWSRTTCPKTSSLVYKGKAGGSWYTSGGGSNLLCMPEDPGYLNTTSRAIHTKVHGVEFEDNGGQYFDSVLRMRERNLPCVVCKADYRAAVLMTPASIKCQDDSWTLEYQGYLMAGLPAHQRASFVCVDKNPEATDGQNSNRNGELLYHTGIDCYTFGDCPPYKSGAELACTVCSK